MGQMDHESALLKLISRGDRGDKDIAQYPLFVAKTADATAAASTYTPEAVMGGLIVRTNTGACNDVTPTAADIITMMAACGCNRVGQAFMFTVVNSSGGANTITLTAGAGVTLLGTMTIAQNNTRTFLAYITSATTVTIVSLNG